jgi:hypothetical protein
MAAGLPVYVSLFGRDRLTAAWQAAMASREMMPGTLAELARWQGTEVNDWRDEQPGKMLHQTESGPLAVLNVNPLGRYYGSITTSGFYPVIVSELWHWTGDKELVRPFVEPALKSLRWLDSTGCPSCSLVTIVTPTIPFLRTIRMRIHRRRGRLLLSGACCRQCSVCTRTRHSICFSSIRTCLCGCRR